jgi:hypothetical protein
MGNLIGIFGPSGSGKTCSLRNFKDGEIGLFNVSGKPLPFQGKLTMANSSDYELMKATLRANNKNCYVLDDVGLSMAFYLFEHVNETGYAKFTYIAKSFYELTQCVIHETSPDTNVFFLMHSERSDDGASIKMKTTGKMIDSQLSLESLFSIVIYRQTDGKRHYFVTQSDGVTTAKSPMEMLPLEMDNDLKAVVTAIREYYGLAKLGTPVKKKEQKNASATVETTNKVPR